LLTEQISKIGSAKKFPQDKFSCIEENFAAALPTDAEKIFIFS
jgi:hypothetical protein